MPRPRSDGSLPLRWQLTADGRSRGSVTQLVRDLLAEQPEGLACETLDRLCRERLGARCPRQPRFFQRMLVRLVGRGEIVLENGLVKAADPRRLRRSR